MTTPEFTSIDHALADVLPLLACGEEAAAATFHMLGRKPVLTGAERGALGVIEAEERVHDAILTGISLRLPTSPTRSASQAAARSFQRALYTRDPVEHLARVAALDSGVCTILSRIAGTRGGTEKHWIVPLLRNIARDEARHVAVARSIVLQRGAGRRYADSAVIARMMLADLMQSVAGPLEKLYIDPDRLDGALRRLPNGLLPAV